MSIKVRCKCSQIIKVPEKLAGKRGKCPKCGNTIQIPAANAGQQQVQQPQTKSAAVSPQTGGALDELFDDAGFEQNKGPTCPGCYTPIVQGSAICVQCGLNFSTGERMSEYRTAAQNAEFENLHLQEAAASMRRDTAMQSRTRNAGIPWWVVLCILMVGILLATAGVVIVDGFVQPEKAPEGTFMGNIQRLPVGYVLLGVVAIGTGLIFQFAHWVLVINAFKDKISKGIMSLLVPFFTGIYGLMRFKELSGVAISYWLSLVISIACAATMQFAF